MPLLEQLLLGLVWRGEKIDHLNNEHDDFANAAAGAIDQILAAVTLTDEELAAIDAINDGAAFINEIRLNQEL